MRLEDLSLEMPRCVRIAGSSMEPTFFPGWTLRVEEAQGLPTVGEIALFSSFNGWLVHRVLGVSECRNEILICHRGDGIGGSGICRAQAFRGRITGVLIPRDTRICSPAEMPKDWRRRFACARRRCMVYFWARRIAPDFVPTISPRLNDLVRRLLLR